MKKLWLSVFLAAGMTANLAAADVAAAAKTALDKVSANTITYRDANGWLYSKNELAHLAKGELAKGAVAKISAAKKNQDPIPALVKFNDELSAAGIKLIVVPVPPKAAIVPCTGLAKGEAMTYLNPFYEELRTKGIDVLDLSDVFLKAGKDNLYCKTDAHWSPAGIALAADELAKKMDIKGTEKYSIAASSVKISGDLAKSLNPAAPETEDLTLQVILGTIAESSPVLLIGDSHTLIFSTGVDMLAEHAGLAENLAAKLGMPVDRIGVKGSAATAVRVNLYRKAAKNPDWLKNKKYVIYCFTCREFTESSSGWVAVPVFKK